MGSTLPHAPAGPLRLFEVKLVVGCVTIQGRCRAPSPTVIHAWFAKRFEGCGYPTITEVADAP